MMVILINPVFAKDLTAGETTWDIKATRDNIPQGDIEDFFDRIKNACENPDEAGNQLPPENIMFTCLRGTVLWGVAAVRSTSDLPNICWLDTWLFCDKDLGSMSERFDLTPTGQCNPHAVIQGASSLPSARDADIDVVECPAFYAFVLYELRVKQGITCEEIEDVESVQAYCMELLADESEVWTDSTGTTVDLCSGVPPIQPTPPDPTDPPTIPGPAVCDGSVFPPAEECCDGAIQPVNGPVCEKACNMISAGNIDNYPYCCDGTVPGSGVSIPGEPNLPAICAAEPGDPSTQPVPVLISVKK